MSTTERTWTIEHTWACGNTPCHTINPARNNECSGCGAPKDISHKEMVPTDMSFENRVKDTDRFNNTNPDWFCSYCTPAVRNADSNVVCIECGSPRGTQKGTASKGQNTTGGGMILKPVIVPSKPSPKRMVEPKPVSVPKMFSANHYRDIEENLDLPKSFNLSRASDWLSENFATFGLVFGGVALVATIIAVCVYLFSWHDTTATVQNTTWSYHVDLHQRQVDHGRDWRDREPAHSFNETCHQEIRSYHNCNPYQCNPHNQSYDCNCRSVESCSPSQSCSTSCSNNGNGSSSCRETCRTVQNCTSRQVCSTCNRTVYDTCYQRCPDYDNMCEFDYPSWPVIRVANTSNHDHTLVRPMLSATNNVACTADPEVLNIQNHAVVQCTNDTVSFEVVFNAGEVGRFTTTPHSLSDYDRYHMGTRWNARYNHAGMFRPLNAR